MATDGKIEEVLKIARETREMTIEERALNNFRFNQLAMGLEDIRSEVSMLKAEINKVYDSLSQDIQVFAIDLQQVKRRVTKTEKRLVS